MLTGNFRAIGAVLWMIVLLTLASGGSQAEAEGEVAPGPPAPSEAKDEAPNLPDAVWLCRKENGYRGIWYWNEKQNDPFVYKYSGGLGTYCAHHYPFAIYVPQVEKTFFCYGGALEDKNELVHMISYFDHRTGQVPRPTALLNKKTDDAHDNPVLAIDGQGHLWIFSSAHGVARRAYVSVSKRPYDIDQFELVAITNFSYPQVYWVEDQGLAFFHTRYIRGNRCLFFMASSDGRSWGPMSMLASIQQGHYQVSAASRRKLATAFNYHPHPQGLNWRTNLYYMESEDFGATWRSADGIPLCLPLTEVKNDALVYDYAAEDWRVYLVDMVLDRTDRPIIVYILSCGWRAGPEQGPRMWYTARWDGRRWVIRPAIVSDHNYDNGSLYVEADGSWLLIVPSEPGPQPFATGGEIVMWRSVDEGATWQPVCQLTVGSEFNHGYCRRPIGAHPQFYALWADGHAFEPSRSCVYFCDRQGNVYRLPPQMETDFASPELVHSASSCQQGGESVLVARDDQSPRQGLACSAGTTDRPASDCVQGRMGAVQFVAMQTLRESSEVDTSVLTNQVGNAGSPLGSAADVRITPEIPTEYAEKIAITPDLCQTDPLFADLPQGGRQLCGPTAFVNILLAISDREKQVAGSTEADQLARARELLKLLTGSYLPVTPQGIAPLPAMEGIERFLRDHGYSGKVEWQGWRYGGRFATGRQVDRDWLCRSILGHSWAIINVGWYRLDRSGTVYQRFGGHWVTLVGFRRDGQRVVLLVHDPARRSGPGKVTHEVNMVLIDEGQLAAWGGYDPQPAAGMYRLEGLPLHPQADCALLDGVIRVEFSPPKAGPPVTEAQ